MKNPPDRYRQRHYPGRPKQTRAQKRSLLLSRKDNLTDAELAAMLTKEQERQRVAAQNARVNQAADAQADQLALEYWT